MIFFFLKGLHSLQRPILWLGEGRWGMHTAVTWYKVSNHWYWIDRVKIGGFSSDANQI